MTAWPVASVGAENAHCAPAQSKSGAALMLFKRKTIAPLKDRLLEFARETRENASQLPKCAKQDMLKSARRADTMAHLDDWANSSGLQPPK